MTLPDLLGLGPEATPEALRAAYHARAAELRARAASAPVEPLRARYAAQLQELEEAWREQAPPSPPPAAGIGGLSATRLGDLPAAAPSYTGMEGAAAGERVALEPGRVLAGRYEVRRKLGAGGMGAVFAALDRVRGEEIAVKVLLPGLTSKPGARERFLAEAKVSLSLSHPLIVRVYDIGSEGELHFLTMELLQGRTLRDAMEERKAGGGRFEVGEALSIAGQLCEALGYAHGRTVHRDVKPENVWLCGDGTIRLMDFGIARLLSSSQLTMTGMALGTAYYMAPEQLGGGEADGRADQYATAVVLYELLAGRVPSGRAKSLSELRGDVGPLLCAAVDRGLSGEAGERFGTMEEFGEALRAGAGRPRRATAARKGARRGSRGVEGVPPRALIVASVVGVVVLGATFPLWSGPAGLWLRRTLRDPQVTARYERLRGEVSGLEEKLVGELATLPAGWSSPEGEEGRKLAEQASALSGEARDEAAVAALTDAERAFRGALDRAEQANAEREGAEEAREAALGSRKKWEELGVAGPSARADAASVLLGTGDAARDRGEWSRAQAAYAEAGQRYEQVLGEESGRLQGEAAAARGRYEATHKALTEWRTQTLNREVSEAKSRVRSLEGEVRGGRGSQGELESARAELESARAELASLEEVERLVGEEVYEGAGLRRLGELKARGETEERERRHGRALATWTEADKEAERLLKLARGMVAGTSARQKARQAEKEFRALSTGLDASLASAAEGDAASRHFADADLALRAGNEEEARSQYEESAKEWQAATSAVKARKEAMDTKVEFESKWRELGGSGSAKSDVDGGAGDTLIAADRALLKGAREEAVNKYKQAITKWKDAQGRLIAAKAARDEAERQRRAKEEEERRTAELRALGRSLAGEYVPVSPTLDVHRAAFLKLLERDHGRPTQTWDMKLRVETAQEHAEKYMKERASLVWDEEGLVMMVTHRLGDTVNTFRAKIKIAENGTATIDTWRVGHYRGQPALIHQYITDDGFVFPERVLARK